MISVLVSLVASFGSWLRSRAALQLELIALRHQLQVLNRVRCGNLVTPQDSTREGHRRDDRGAQYERHRLPTPLQSAVVAPVARATALDEAGDHCSDRRTLQGLAQGALGSGSAAGRDIRSGRCARTVRQRRWLVARGT